MYSNRHDTDQITLPNGRQLHIRALRRGEDAPVRELFARLSPRTRYFRFLSPTNVLPDAFLRTLTGADDPRRLALIAELDHADGGDIIALGNVSESHDDRGEVGLVVADTWQRQGIGTALAARLLQAAEYRGYQRFLIQGFSDNPALRPLLNHIADVVSASNAYMGVSEFTVVRRLAPALTGAAPHLSKTPVRDPLERAYQRILAAKGRRERW